MSESTNHQTLLQIVSATAVRPEVRRAVARLYGQIQEATDQRRPRCVMSGRCCRFEEYGHRLFVTTMELACFHHELQAMRAGDSSHRRSSWDGSGCPFQRSKLCSVHAIRPMGCRLFFCDATAEQWQQALYEQCHGELRRLHDELQVPYRYMEWRTALREIGMV
jgi:Fe-S-cluster containining protein